MSLEYIIYCDESANRGKYFSNFYGGALVRSKDLNFVENCLKEKMAQLNLHQEVKWSKITENYCRKYISLIESFFELVRKDNIKLRIMFTQNAHVATNLSNYHKEHEYFLLYYQFIKYAFGLQYSNNTTFPINIRLYFDQLPVTTREKVEQFKSYIHGLSLNPSFRKARVVINQDQIAEVKSHEHVILQCLDIVLGAIQFRLNDRHKDKILGTNIRGKRTVAKEQVYKHIYNLIKSIYPNFNIGSSTGIGNNRNNCWHHPYRHWLFKAKNHLIDNKQTKKQKINPASAMLCSVSQVELETSQ